MHYSSHINSVRYRMEKSDISKYRTFSFPVLYCTVLYCAVLLYCTVLYCTVLLYCTILQYTVPHCTVLYCTVPYRTVLYCTVLCCALLYCTVPLYDDGSGIAVALCLADGSSEMRGIAQHQRLHRWFFTVCFVTDLLYCRPIRLLIGFTPFGTWLYLD